VVPRESSGGSRILSRGGTFLGGGRGRIFLVEGRESGRILRVCRSVASRAGLLSATQRLHTAGCRDGVGAGGGRRLPLRGSVLLPEIFLFVSVRMCIFEC